MSRDRRFLTPRVVRRLAMPVAALSLVGSVFVIGPVDIAGAGGSFDLTISQAKNMTACMPRSKIDPSGPRVCLSAVMWLSHLPSIVTSSNSQFDWCNVAIGVFVVGDIIELPEALTNPLTLYGFANELNDEYESVAGC